MSPRTQVSEGLMFSVPPLKVIKQMSSETWGRQKCTPVSMSTYLPPPLNIQSRELFHFFPFGKNQVVLTAAAEVRV